MKKLLCIAAILCLLAGATASYAAVLYSDNFDADFPFAPSNWTIFTGWNSASAWVVNEDGRAQCLDAGGDVARGFLMYGNPAMVSAPANIVFEADLYGFQPGSEAGLMFRTTDQGNGFLDQIYLMINPFAYGPGRAGFTWFDLAGPGGLTFFNDGNLPGEGGADLGFGGDNYFHPATDTYSGDVIHVKATALGNQYTAILSLYDNMGNLRTATTLTATGPAGSGTGGLFGLHTYSSSVQFDNVVVSDVPEPGSLMALLTGLGFAAAAIRRRKA